MAKRFDPKAKARKQKIVAAVLGVLLLGVLVFQAPTILGLVKGSSSSVKSEPAPSTPTTPAAPAGSTPTAPAPSASAGLIDSDAAVEPGQGQLVTFDRFASKDPFAPQVGGRSPASGAPPAATPAPPRETRQAAQQQAPATQSRGAVRTATISVNGVSSQVSVSSTFPEGDPIFKLVSLTKTTAKVGIVDGTYATGSQTIALKKGGKPVTLINTADGTTYVLRLVAVA